MVQMIQVGSHPEFRKPNRTLLAMDNLAAGIHTSLTKV